MPEEDIESEEREEQPISFYTPPELFEKLVDVDTAIERIELLMKGYTLKKDVSGIYKTVKIGKPVLNEEGIQELVGIMRKRLDHILTATSILDQRFIQLEVYFFNLNLIEILSKKGKEWGLDTAHFQELIDWLVQSYEAILRKGLGGAFLNKILVSPMEEKKEKRWFFF
jgi:hypothetical protein